MTTNNDEPLAIASVLLPDDRRLYRVGDALEVIATAMQAQDTAVPSDDAELIASVARGRTFDKHKQMLEAAAVSGEATILNPLDKMPHTLPMGRLLLDALIPRDELQRFAHQRLRIELRTTDRGLRPRRHRCLLRGARWVKSLTPALT